MQLAASSLKEVSAVPAKLKERTDWVFTFSAEGERKLPQGERRIAVRIAGDKVADVFRFVHVPEQWDRQERDRQTIPGIMSAGCTIALVAVVLGGIVVAIVSWSRRQYVVSTFLLLFALLLVFNVAGLLNSIPSLTAQFSTAQPYPIQMFVLVGAGILAMVLQAAAMGLVAGLVHQWCPEDKPGRGSAWLIGLSLGAVAAGVLAFAASLNPLLAPKWADFDPLNTFAPLLAVLAGPVSGYFTQSIMALFVFAGLNRLSRNWTRRRIPCGILLFLFGFVISGGGAIETIPSWLIRGAIAGCLLLAGSALVLRYSARPLLIAVGVFLILGILKQGAYAAYPLALPGSVAAAVLMGLAVWFWHRRLVKG